MENVVVDNLLTNVVNAVDGTEAIQKWQPLTTRLGWLHDGVLWAPTLSNLKMKLDPKIRDDNDHITLLELSQHLDIFDLISVMRAIPDSQVQARDALVVRFLHWVKCRIQSRCKHDRGVVTDLIEASDFDEVIDEAPRPFGGPLPAPLDRMWRVAHALAVLEAQAGAYTRGLFVHGLWEKSKVDQKIVLVSLLAGPLVSESPVPPELSSEGLSTSAPVSDPSALEIIANVVAVACVVPGTTFLSTFGHREYRAAFDYLEEHNLITFLAGRGNQILAEWVNPPEGSHGQDSN